MDTDLVAAEHWLAEATESGAYVESDVESYIAASRAQADREARESGAG